MIFLTVGTQLPFDRLVRAVDQWAGVTAGRRVVAQTGPGDYTPRHLQHRPYVTPCEFKGHVEDAELIISHAGMGSILSALGLGKPILVMPRMASMGEHRNDHQISTARRLREMGRVNVAMDEQELLRLLDDLPAIAAGDRIGPHASRELLTCLDGFISRPPPARPQPRAM